MGLAVGCARGICVTSVMSDNSSIVDIIELRCRISDKTMVLLQETRHRRWTIKTGWRNGCCYVSIKSSRESRMVSSSVPVAKSTISSRRPGIHRTCAGCSQAGSPIYNPPSFPVHRSMTLYRGLGIPRTCGWQPYM